MAANPMLGRRDRLYSECIDRIEAGDGGVVAVAGYIAIIELDLAMAQMADEAGGPFDLYACWTCCDDVALIRHSLKLYRPTDKDWRIAADSVRCFAVRLAGDPVVSALREARGIGEEHLLSIDYLARGICEALQKTFPHVTACVGGDEERAWLRRAKLQDGARLTRLKHGLL
jgi:hypothetical protein